MYFIEVADYYNGNKGYIVSTLDKVKEIIVNSTFIEHNYKKVKSMILNSSSIEDIEETFNDEIDYCAIKISSIEEGDPIFMMDR